MYTLLLKDDKSLLVTHRETIHQRESLVDKLKFFIPKEHDGVDLSDFTCVLKWVDTANIPHAEILVKDDDLYKDTFLQYELPVDSKITQFAGEIYIRLSWVSKTGNDYEILHSDTARIVVEPVADDYHFVEGTAEAFVDKLIADKMKKPDKPVEDKDGDILDLEGEEETPDDGETGGDIVDLDKDPEDTPPSTDTCKCEVIDLGK